jgi:hypothetical protein
MVAAGDVPGVKASPGEYKRTSSDDNCSASNPGLPWGVHAAWLSGGRWSSIMHCWAIRDAMDTVGCAGRGGSVCGVKVGRDAGVMGESARLLSGRDMSSAGDAADDSVMSAISTHMSALGLIADKHSHIFVSICMSHKSVKVRPLIVVIYRMDTC